MSGVACYPGLLRSVENGTPSLTEISGSGGG